jgi:protein tyrosine phosphatase (PTP) superfamily phosphohydrolase (DUF442 family)
MKSTTLKQKRWIGISIVLLSFLLLPSMQVLAHEKMSGKTVQVKLLKPFGTLEQVYQIGNLYFAAQPDKATLEYFKKLGGKTVINLRDPSELKFDERQMAHGLGLRYYNFPVPGKQPVNPSIMLAISWAIEHEGDVPIFVHCSSGNRAAVALGAHFTRKLSLTQDEAVVVAERAGLTKPGSRKKLIALLQEGLTP